MIAIFGLAIILLSLDVVYFTFVQQYMRSVIQTIQRSPLQLNWKYALLCYALLALGLHRFILLAQRPALEAFLLGVFVYGVYETTNAALFKQWPLPLVLLDTLWGGILFLVATVLFRRFLSPLR
jgi:uncharacterized membrane protein